MNLRPGGPGAPAAYLADRRRERNLALLLALAALAGACLLAAVIPAIDLAVLRKSVDRLFSVQVSPRAGESSQMTAESAARLGRELAEGGGKQLFAPPAQEAERPRGADSMQASLPATPRLPERAPAPAPPAIAKTAFEAALPGDAIPVLTRPAKRPAARLPRSAVPAPQELYATGRESGGGPGRPGGQENESGKNLLLAPPPPGSPAPAPDGWRPRLPAEPLHSLGPKAAGLGLETPVSSCAALNDEIDAAFTLHRVAGSPEARFRLVLSLRPASTLPALAKDCLFLLDTSQSVKESELARVRSAVLDALGRLNPDDRWNGMLFSERLRRYAPAFLPAADFAARQAEVRGFIRKDYEERRTDVAAAVEEILTGIPRSERPLQVFFLTDGLATEGAADTAALIAGFRRIRRDACAVFPFNAGPGGDAQLLALVAYRSRGAYGEAVDLDGVAAAFASFTAAVADPVLSETTLQIASLDTREVYPVILPPLYRGQPLVIHGLCTPGREVLLRLAGLREGRRFEYFFRAAVPESGTAEEVTRGWAEEKARALLAELAARPEDRALRDRILRLAEEYHLDSVKEETQPRRLFAPLRRLFAPGRAGEEEPTPPPPEPAGR